MYCIGQKTCPLNGSSWANMLKVNTPSSARLATTHSTTKVQMNTLHGALVVPGGVVMMSAASKDGGTGPEAHEGDQKGSITK